MLAVDRASGKIVWQRPATTAVPHEGYHGRYGSFASNAPATDGQRVYASFGSRGVYVYPCVADDARLTRDRLHDDAGVGLWRRAQALVPIWPFDHHLLIS